MTVATCLTVLLALAVTPAFGAPCTTATAVCTEWVAAGAAVRNAAVTSYGVMDDILTRLARREAFPNLRTIVLAGHSPGGQFVSRYQMANQVHEKLNVPIADIVANPPSYGYLDTMRPSCF